MQNLAVDVASAKASSFTNLYNRLKTSSSISGARNGNIGMSVNHNAMQGTGDWALPQI